MHRMLMSRMYGHMLAMSVAAIAVSSCHHDVSLVGPDVAQAQVHRLNLVNNRLPPSLVQTFVSLGVGGKRFLVDGEMMPIDLGRGIESRLFDDRSGIGETGGHSRDSSAVSG